EREAEGIKGKKLRHGRGDKEDSGDGRYCFRLYLDKGD
ncbi:hypothetical protein B0813_001566, partial [Candidatus Fervidibacteria bacterium JGI MDM2 SSWTFF-3-K9]